jgi:hypothetical protein
MIDPEREHPITLREATKLRQLARNGRRPHIASLYRWAEAGIKGVQLETLQIGGSRVTSREAANRFIAALTAKANGDIKIPGVRTPNRRQKDHDRADRELTKSGW